MKFPRAQDGITLPELSVGLTLAAIAATLSFGIFSATQNNQLHNREISDAQSDLRVVAARMTSELRTAGGHPRGDDPNCLPYETIPTATATSIHFRSDLDGDCDVDGSSALAEDVMYSWDADEQRLYRVTGSDWAVLLGGVEQFSIRYYAADGSELPAPLDPRGRHDVRALRIDLSVRGADGMLRAWSTTTGFRNDLQG